jgi:predicted NUDIX family NTP pyrophosphohydrolase
MPRPQSAGVLMFRRRASIVEVLLVHPGGPYWHRKDEGAWTIPKGEFAAGESAEQAARREFEEETGFKLEGELVPLTPVRQKSGKIVHPFAIAGDLDAEKIRSNTFTMEWPTRSGTMREFPEIDRAQWFTFDDAERKLIDGQRPMLAELQRLLDDAGVATRS